MKITVIGAGNMGGAIIRGLIASQRLDPHDITAVAVHASTLSAMSELGVMAVNDASQAVGEADVVLLAVKPWIIESVATKIAPFVGKQTLIGSVAAGIDFDTLASYFAVGTPLFRIIPNTAVTVGESMTFIASQDATPEQAQLIVSLFEPLGPVMEIPQSQVGACTALASCGVAFALRYVRAAMEGGIELGVPPLMAQTIVAQTIKGAAQLLLSNGSHPEAEIDKVTTPGGITIKGLNAMEANGFTHAVVQGLKAAK